MKFLLFIAVCLAGLNVSASESSKASVVLNHLMTVGRNDQGFEKLPDKLKLNGWAFESFPPNFYYVHGPEGKNKKTYEYAIRNGEIESISTSVDAKEVVLYTREACLEVYKGSLSIKAEESLLDTTTNVIFKKHGVQGTERKPKDIWYARNYAKNCKLIFGFDQGEVLNQIVKESNNNGSK